VKTRTIYWAGVESKALIVFIPGGNGILALDREDNVISQPYYRSLKNLSDAQVTTGHIDVVLIEFPNPLNQQDLSLRENDEHMTRIKRVIEFYAQKTKLPIWLMGHSNGGVSLGNYVRYLQKNHKLGTIAGLIASAIRNESSFYFKLPLNLPILFIHHMKDQCQSASSEYSIINYNRVRQINNSVTQFQWILGGESENKDPCLSGFHMYFKSEMQMIQSIEQFIVGR
jgi:hypothetical protein